MSVLFTNEKIEIIPKNIRRIDKNFINLFI